MNNNSIQPYNPDNRISLRRSRRRQPKGNSHAGPRCPLCNSGSVQPFSSIYGFGTTKYRTSKGLFVPHGFEKTRRQSVMAEKCAPLTRCHGGQRFSRPQLQSVCTSCQRDW